MISNFLYTSNGNVSTLECFCNCLLIYVAILSKTVHSYYYEVCVLAQHGMITGLDA